MYKKRIKSAFELLSNPSAILFEIDIDALQIWLLKDLSSFFVNTEYILTAKSWAFCQAIISSNF